MKLRTGEPTEKETITAIVLHNLEKASSLDTFTDQLKILGYEVYFRNGAAYGVVGKRKYRFNTLGLALDKFDRGTKFHDGRIVKNKRNGHKR